MKQSRRRFIQSTAAIAAAPWWLDAKTTGALAVVIDPGKKITQEKPAQWAAQQLQTALQARGLTAPIYENVAQAPRGVEAIVLEARPGFAPESFSLAREGRHLFVRSADARGLVYGALELADRVKYARDPRGELAATPPETAQPANRVRSLMRLFVSDVEDKPWFNDRAFWREYLTMAATERFNRFNLAFGLAYDFTSGIRDCYFHFAYPFLLCPAGYDVRAAPLPDAERDSNLAMLRFISEQAAARGLQFFLGLWTHAWHWTDSPHANYTITGLTRENQAAYCRDALRALLQACPAISGLTIRTHGESGVSEGSYDFWREVFAGAAQCGRPVELDLHAKGLDQTMIDAALATGLPVTVAPKFWAEHAGLPYMPSSIRDLELPPRRAQDSGFFGKSTGSRSFLRYSYGDLLTEGRKYSVLHRVWPGTQRLLLWGSPEWAAAFGRRGSFCGSDGVEYMEPLSFKGRKGSGLPGGRDGYANEALRPAGGDWTKYLYTYRLWGRLAYDPDAAPDAWRRMLRAPWGAAAAPAEAALNDCSRILPLVTTAHCPSAANNNYWPEIYSNMAIVDDRRPLPFDDTPTPKRFGTVSPLDPHLFAGVDEHAQLLLRQETSHKYSPLEVAQWLEQLAQRARAHLASAEAQAPSKSAAWQRWRADARIQCSLGLFFAWKFRAGVQHAIFRETGHAPALAAALAAYRRARAAWAEAAETARGIYRADLTFGYDAHLRGHWSDRLPAIDADIADMEKQQHAAQDAGPEAAAALGATLIPPVRPNGATQHSPPPNFRSGQAVALQLKAPAYRTARLWYRRVNQVEPWLSVAMSLTGDHFAASIPADAASGVFPLQYHFECRDQAGACSLVPGLGPELSRQPYYIMRPQAA
ncbi:MAG TPA: hypothetical protein VHB20_13995 [Verrucomicrobiae bacterium]|jgi:hypothetical protein|nr:hypothetical protein [Verrucomicrobiae bacterium]